MAVEDKYTDSDITNSRRSVPFFTEADGTYSVVAIASIAAADDDGSVYRVIPNIRGELVPLKIEILSTAITGGTDYDLGLYDVQSGSVVDADVLVDGVDLSSGAAQGSEVSGLSAVALADSQKRLYELGGKTALTREPVYDIALTANTVGTAAGTVVVKATFGPG